jgi:hypothetical protein
MSEENSFENQVPAISSPIAPAIIAMFWACSAMWPRWMPVVASALRRCAGGEGP